MGDHLNSGIRNIVVRGPGLNCRRCSSVIGIPRNPKSTRKSRSCWVTDRPCIAYINKKFKSDANCAQCVFEYYTESEKGQDKTMWPQTTGDFGVPRQAVSFSKWAVPSQISQCWWGVWLAPFSATHQSFTLRFFTWTLTEKTKCSPSKTSNKTLFICNSYILS